MASMCAACGQPGHRYGRNEGMERFDPQACINGLLHQVEQLKQADMYRQGWGDELDAARFPALLDIAEAAVALVEKQDGSDPRDTAIEEFDLRIAVRYLASRLDTEGRHG